LKKVARFSGGRYDPAPEELFAESDRRVTRPIALWPWLLSVALALLLFDIALRRIDFTLHRPFARRPER